MKRRVSYIVHGDGDASASQHVRAPNKDTAVVSGLVASKHVRLRLENAADAALGVATLQWARARLLDLPFDPPAALGTHVDASLAASPDAVHAWAAALGVDIGVPVETDSWFAWYSSHAPDFEGSGARTLADGLASKLADELAGADAVRVSTNPSTDELIAEAWFASREWTETVSAPAEMGVLSAAHADGHMALRGRVRKLGVDEKSEPMLVSWYPRHRPTAGSVHAQFVEPYGLHPVLELAVESAKPLPVCRLFAKLDLPTEVFLDQYQLEDLPRYTPPSTLVEVWGETDLELPVWAVHGNRSIGLLMLDDAGSHRIPLHLRNAPPSTALELAARFPEPSVYWACRDDRMPERRKLEDRESVGIESVYPLENTAFYVVESNGFDFRVPAIGPGPERMTELTTLAVVIVGFVAVLGSVVHALWWQPKAKTD